MPINKLTYEQLRADLGSHQVTLVAVSKTKSVEEIKELYDLGHRDFGENYEQELLNKQSLLPDDIRWHFIGHLQSNKVKKIAPFIHLIQSVDSLKLLKEINKQGEKSNRIINCLLQVHIAEEETKFGLDELELGTLMDANLNELKKVKVCGLMGMASFTDDMDNVKSEFKNLKTLFDKFKRNHSTFEILSMGMSADYSVAVDEGSTMVRIGSLIFGERS